MVMQDSLEILALRYVIDTEDAHGSSTEVLAAPEAAWTCPSARKVRQALQGLQSEGEPIGMVTVGSWMRARGEHDHFALVANFGLQGITGSSAVITSGEFRQAMDRINEFGKKKCLQLELQSSLEILKNPGTSADDVIKRLVTKISGNDVTLQRSTAIDPVMLDAALEEYAKRLEDRKRHAQRIRTGFPVLDQITNGMAPCQFIVLASRPAMGKSALAEQITSHAARWHGPALYISYEMNREELAERWTSQMTFKSKSRHTPEDARLGKGLPIYIYDAGNSLKLLVKRCKRFVKAHPDTSVIVVDQIGLARLENYNANRTAVVSEISFELKSLAMQLRVPVLGLHQIGRGAEKDGRGNKRPTMADLKDSGRLEEDADMVWTLYRESYYDRNAGDNAELDVAKNRGGAPGTVKLKWLPWALTYESVEPDAPTRPTRSPKDEPAEEFTPLADIAMEDIPL